MHQEYQYLNLLEKILKEGVKNYDRGTGATSYSLFGYQQKFDLNLGFPLLTTKKVYWKGVLTELFWFLKGENNIQYLTKNNTHIWDDYPYKIYVKKLESKKQKPLSKEEFANLITNDDKFAEKWGALKNIYGDMWRNWPTKTNRKIDQLQWVLDELKADPDARNLIVNSWNPEYLYDMALPEEALRFPICHNMYQISQKNGKLSLHLYQRSADMFLGVPFNIASYALLTNILAHLSGYEVGEFIHTFGDLHIYDDHIEQCQEQITRIPRDFPTLKIDSKATSLETILPEHILLENYNPYPTLKGNLTVSGGLYEGKIN